jgi:uncharacterized membrane protein (UPF0136 family)
MRSAMHVHPVRDCQASNKKASPFLGGAFLFTNSRSDQSGIAGTAFSVVFFRQQVLLHAGRPNGIAVIIVLSAELMAATIVVLS